MSEISLLLQIKTQNIDLGDLKSDLKRVMCQIDVNIVKSLCSDNNNNFTVGCCLQQMQFILKLQNFLNGKKIGKSALIHNVGKEGGLKFR